MRVLDKGFLIDVIIKNKFNTGCSDFIASRDFDEYEIGIIECKTNWKDNAQIPMLWDVIYSANGWEGRNITVGKEGDQKSVV